MLPGDFEAHVEGHFSLPTVCTHKGTWVKEGDKVAVSSKQYGEARYTKMHSGNV